MTKLRCAAATAGAVAALLSGCSVEPACGEAVLEPLPREPAYAVVTSDYLSTAIALLDEDGELVSSAWVDSGTTAAGLSATMSGDVVLPTEPVREGELWWIDRLGVDVTTHVAVPEGEVLGQIPLSLPAERGEAAFKANPYDALALDDDRILVSRFERNAAADARPLDRGNDLVIVDVGSEELVDRIPLDVADTQVPAADPEADPPIAIQARPGRMVRTGERVVVGLARLSRGFSAAGPGAIAVVDPASGEVQVVELEGLQNCPEVAPVAGDPRRALAVCMGPLDALSPEERRPSAGAVMVHVPVAGPAVVEHRFEASDHPDVPPVARGIVSLGGTRVVAAAVGGGDVPDRLVALDLATAETDTVLESAAPFELGPGTFDPDANLLLVPDASAGVHRLELDPTGQPLLARTTDVSPCRALPPREVRPL